MKKIFILISTLLFSIGYVEAEQIINIDGSSTVYPITEAVAEEFQNVNKDVKVVVGISGTGGGFKRFCVGETDINDASRKIKEKEDEIAKQNGIEYIEIPIAYDAITVVVNPKNTWVDYLTVAELKKIWEPEAQNKITKWQQARPNFPNKEIHLFGPGTDSGTFDYFTEEVCGKSGASRGDYTASEDDNVLVAGVAFDELSLGYFGFAYYEENKDKLKPVAIDNGNGPVLPSFETVINGTYKPLARTVYIYVSKKSAQKPFVKEFVEFYLKNAPILVKEVGYIPLSLDKYQEELQRFQEFLR